MIVKLLCYSSTLLSTVSFRVVRGVTLLTVPLKGNGLDECMDMKEGFGWGEGVIKS